MKNNKILIVDDDKSVLASLLILFKHNGFEPTIESEPKKIPDLIKQNDFSAVILDMNFRRGFNDGKEGLSWLSSIKRYDKNISVILFTAYGDIDLAVEAVQKGASDFILKPWNNNELISKVKTVIEKKKKAEKSTIQLKLVGESGNFREAITIADKVSNSPVSVIIHGEKGVGKSVLAKYIQTKYNSSVIEVDLINESISDLNIANNKTVILKNIESLAAEDIKNLKSLFEDNPNAKFISTYNSSIENRHKKDIFGVFLIDIGLENLNQRSEDVKILSNHFLDEFSDKYQRKAKRFSDEAIKLILNHNWTENVKELQHVVERAVLLSDTEEIQTDELKFSTFDNKSKSAINTLNLSDLEKEAILRAIDEAEGNITKASKKLGITRTALYRRMEKYDL